MHSILVVDDEAHMRRILSLQLGRRGYHVEEARNGAEALERLEEHQFHAVISDVSMPVMDGRRLCARIRESDPVSPVLFLMTSHSTQDWRSWLDEVGNVEVMEKPLSVRRLLRRLAERLGEPESAEAHP